MRHRVRRGFLVLGTLLWVILAWNNTVITGEMLEGYHSAKFCSNCHQDIYNTWSKAMHANAVKDPIFEANFLLALKDGDEEVRAYCLKCHAPTTRMTKDIYLKQELTWEGVTCDFCHSISAVDLANSNEPFTIEPGDTKYGPYRDAVSKVHKTKYSELHLTSEFCAGCHELKNKNGVPILETYSEWKKGPYAALGKTCQQCHMPLEEHAKIVLPEVKQSTKRVNTHNLQGGHSIQQLTTAAKVKIASVKRSQESLIIEVEISNEGSGHMIPTGTPSRKLDLSVELRDGDKVIDRQVVRYEKMISDQEGNRLWRDVDIMLKGAKIVSDNRLSPKEKRKQVFIFPNPKKQNFSINANLTYNYQPLVIQVSPMEITMGEDTQKVSGSVVSTR
ncbi:MAG: hypothetical protein HY730_02710 [Candidatus Tectomicrobia bacterium]|uniref:Cytochrome c-552/4 domain-containing protein n=1 Tax=Tectimicrobiota bacterium TaxID=2528274 RepID=A0A933GLE3_UNCTE|nr:hypothetical protein [Candidatus Tectomicrobia bacterium]